MKKVSCLLFFVSIMLIAYVSGCEVAQNETITGNGVIESKSANLQSDEYSLIIKDISFDNKTIKSDMLPLIKSMINIDSKNEDQVTISTDNNILPFVTLNVDDDKKTILICGNPDITYDISSMSINIGVSLDDISIAGAYKIKLFESDMNTVDIKLDGAFFCDFDLYNIKEINYTANGVLETKMVGNCEMIRSNIQGIQDIDCLRLEADNAIICFNGIGEYRVLSLNTLDVTAEGFVTILYDGNPIITCNNPDKLSRVD